jgi:hypothetical protein
VWGFIYLFFILSFSSLLYLGLNHGRWIFHFWTDSELLAMVAAVLVDISARGCHAVFFFAFLCFFLGFFDVRLLAGVLISLPAYVGSRGGGMCALAPSLP